jgi:hypothetical protein
MPAPTEEGRMQPAGLAAFARRIRGGQRKGPEAVSGKVLLALAVLLTCGAPACAVYRKCGFAGCPGDAQITAAVETRLHEHPAVGPPNLIRVQTLDHVVYLYGLVDTELERYIAESAARETPGVARVVDSIDICCGR